MYLDDNKILYRYQSGFRARHSTNTCLSYLSDKQCCKKSFTFLQTWIARSDFPHFKYFHENEENNLCISRKELMDLSMIYQDFYMCLSLLPAVYGKK